MKEFQIGIDLGGTKIETILFNPAGEKIHRKRIATPRGGSDEYDGILHAVYRLIEETRAEIPGKATFTIGVGIPGVVNPATDLVHNANTTCLIGEPFQKDLENLLGRPIGMENDANCFALAESLGGSASGYGVVFGMILGTGCGGGIVINGKIHHGKHMIAGEWGHFSIDPEGLPCYCGNRGCVETKISGTGVAGSHFLRYKENLSLEQIVERYRDGDASCTHTFEQFLDDFGRCTGGLISTLDPDAIVIGGGVSNIDELYDIGLDRVRKYVFHDDITTPILKNSLGDSAGVYGAAWIGV